MAKILKNKFLIVGVMIFLVMALTTQVVSSLGPTEKVNQELSYRTDLGNCPSRPAGTMALMVVKNFEETNSLRIIKQKIVSEKWSEKYFVFDYKIDYEPVHKLLKMHFNCPAPLMKVQLYKNGTSESYEAILVENGELVDPTYEAILRQEKKLTKSLPFLALPVGDIDNKIQNEMTALIKEMRTELRKKLSEVIVNDNKELTIILSISGHPSSVFLGPDEWEEKMAKLDKIVSYMESKEKVPAIINLTNSKKVVVKFKDKF